MLFAIAELLTLSTRAAVSDSFQVASLEKIADRDPSVQAPFVIDAQTHVWWRDGGVRQLTPSGEHFLTTLAGSRAKITGKPVPMDRVGIKRYDDKGELIGEDRFLGLFTSAAYSRSVREIPMLRLKFKRALDKAGLDPRSHNGKALVEILETFPRDEFFQITDADLFEIARGILLLQERHRVALFVRKDVFERFVSCYVFVPRDRYTPDFKDRARQILEEAFDGRDTAIYDHVTDSPLARGLFVVRTPGRIPSVDIKRVEAYLAEAARTWSDRRNTQKRTGLCDFLFLMRMMTTSSSAH